MENSLPAIANLREEFAAHTAKKNGLRFQPSLEASTNISTLRVRRAHRQKKWSAISAVAGGEH